MRHRIVERCALRIRSWSPAPPCVGEVVHSKEVLRCKVKHFRGHTTSVDVCHALSFCPTRAHRTPRDATRARPIALVAEHPARFERCTRTAIARTRALTRGSEHNAHDDAESRARMRIVATRRASRACIARDATRIARVATRARRRRDDDATSPFDRRRAVVATRTVAIARADDSHDRDKASATSPLRHRARERHALARPTRRPTSLWETRRTGARTTG